LGTFSGGERRKLCTNRRTGNRPTIGRRQS
jgi:hypothetical protein